MKTPREILFARHRSANPKLDRIREKVVRSIEGQTSGHLTKYSDSTGKSCRDRVLSWRDLLRSFRWHLGGLSAAWLLILLLNHEPLAGSTEGPGTSAGAPQRLLAAVRENRRQIIELLGPQSAEPAASATRPRRRSERSSNRLTYI